MEKTIKKTIEYLKLIPKEYQAMTFPIILEHELLEVRRLERKEDGLAFRRKK